MRRRRPRKPRHDRAPRDGTAGRGSAARGVGRRGIGGRRTGARVAFRRRVRGRAPLEHDAGLRHAWARLARAHWDTRVSSDFVRDVVSRLPRRRGRARVLGAMLLTFAAAFAGGYTGLTPVPFGPHRPPRPPHESHAAMPLEVPTTIDRPSTIDVPSKSKWPAPPAIAPPPVRRERAEAGAPPPAPAPPERPTDAPKQRTP